MILTYYVKPITAGRKIHVPIIEIDHLNFYSQTILDCEFTYNKKYKITLKIVNNELNFFLRPDNLTKEYNFDRQFLQIYFENA